MRVEFVHLAILKGEEADRPFFLFPQDTVAARQIQPGDAHRRVRVAKTERDVRSDARGPVVEVVRRQVAECVVCIRTVEPAADGVDVVGEPRPDIGEEQILLIDEVKLAELEVLPGEH